MNWRVVLTIALAVAGVEANAQDHAVTAKLGMLGLGVEYTFSVSDRFAVRGGLYGSSFSFNDSRSEIQYDFEVDWDSISIALDYHPRTGPFRLTVGVLPNDNGLSATGIASRNVTIGGTTYTPSEAGRLQAEMGFDKVAPFVGLGWDWSRSKRFGVALDIGVLSQGSPEVALSADGTLFGDPLFQAELAEEEAELEHSLRHLDLFPFAILGAVFRF